MKIDEIKSIDGITNLAILDTSSISFLQNLQTKITNAHNILSAYDLILIPKWVLIELSDAVGRSTYVESLIELGYPIKYIEEETYYELVNGEDINLFEIVWASSSKLAKLRGYLRRYVLKEYKKYHPKSKFIAYGADLHDEQYGLDHLDTLYKWYKGKGIVNHDYYLIVGRFVPENNYETMIREFMKSKTHRKLVIVTNVEKNKFYNKLKEKTHFDKDPRICFVGTVYDSKLLYLIRKNAFAYLHGHEVGGTNPSLLESLASTSLNILLNVDFNNTVGLDGAKYFTKEQGNLADLIDSIEKSMSEEEIEELGKKAKQRIKDAYNWPFIIQSYEDLFLEKNV